MKQLTLFFACVLCISFSTIGCKSSTDTTPPATTGALNGTIYYNVNSLDNVYKLDLASGTVTQIAALKFPNALTNKWILGWVNGDLAEISPDGAQSNIVVKQLQTAPYNMSFFNPQASVDGKYIAYDDDALYTRVFVVDRNGTLVQTFGDGNSERYSRPVWASDGTLYMAGEYGHYGLFRSDKNFTTITRIDPNLNQPIHPSVSPNGKQLAFVVGGHVWTMNVDGTNVTQITTGSGTEDYPVWSPDGQWIVAYSSPTIEFIAVQPGTTNVIHFTQKYPVYATNGYIPSMNGQFDWK